MDKLFISDILNNYYEAIIFSTNSNELILLNEVEFYNCTFNNIQFFKSTLTNCRFENCTFNNCDLSLSNIKESHFLEVEFNCCKLAGLDWRTALKPFTIKFDECKLNDSIFFGLDLRGAEFIKSEVRHCDFEKCNLAKVSFSESDLLNSKFVNTNLNESDFTYSVNYSIDPQLNKIKKAKFSQPEVLALLDGFNILIE